MTTPTNDGEGFAAGLLGGLGIKTRAHKIAAVGLIPVLILLAMVTHDPARADREVAAASAQSATEILHTSAIAQCREAVEFTNRRAKMGFDNVKTTKRGDILVEQPFSVPVFGMAERDNYIARCVLRKNGNFEFGVESDRRRLG